MVKVNRLLPLSPSSWVTLLMESCGSGAPPTVSEKSSMAKPSSAPVASKSTQRRQNVLPTGIETLLIVAAKSWRLPAALPSLAPTVAVLGVLKSSPSTSTQVPVVSEVALRLY